VNARIIVAPVCVKHAISVGGGGSTIDVTLSRFELGRYVTCKAGNLIYAC
jgi:hypothetical protein